MLHEGPPVEPRGSASVLLLRQTSSLEVLMIRRPEAVDFAPGAHVFPGGSVHAHDGGGPESVVSAAARELFEEVGILLARSRRGFAGRRDIARLRAALSASNPWPEALAHAGLAAAPDRLVPFARWVTPEPLRRRFDTTFYLARSPESQSVEPAPAEVVEWAWVEPLRALEDPNYTLVYATRRILESIAGESDLSRLIRRVRRRRRIPVVRPRLVSTDAGWSVVV